MSCERCRRPFSYAVRKSDNKDQLLCRECCTHLRGGKSWEERATPLVPKRLDIFQAAARKLARERAERVAVLRLLAGREEPVLVPAGGPTFEGWTLLVHRDTYPDHPGDWRVSRFDQTGEPVGHCNPSTFAACLREVQDWDGDLRFARLAKPALGVSSAADSRPKY